MKSKGVILTAKTAMLACLAIVLNIFEGLLPPLPFIMPGARLGISNIVTMVGIDALGFLPTLCVVALKSLFVLITRGASAFLMSICGGILSFAAMYLAAKSKKIKFSSVGIGITGAFFHNMGQLLAAMLVVGGAVFGYGAVLCFLSVISGSITGLTFGIIIKRLPSKLDSPL